MNISIALRRATVSAAALGLFFATATFAKPPPPPPPAAAPVNEAWSSCSSTLCIDAPPGPNGEDGSGGWGFGTTAPVTTLTKGTDAILTVTAMQVSPCADATITLTYSTHDFTYVGNGDDTAICNSSPFDRGGVETCSYTDFGHTDKGDSFTFTPKNPTKTALITATVNTSCNGPDQASETFPVAIVAP
jgi:hypothetical protein